MITWKCKTKNKIAYFFIGLVVLSIFQAVVIAQPAMGQCIEPAQQQEGTSLQTSAIENIIADNSHYHLGNDFKEDLTPKEPEGVIYAKTFLLDSGFESPELALMANSVSPYEINATEYMDRIYINDVEVALLNCYFKPPPVSLSTIDTKLEDDLNKGIVSGDLKSVFKTNGFPLSDDASIISWKGKENIWTISDPSSSQKLIIIKEGGKLDVYPPSYSPEAPGYVEVDISFDPSLLKIGNNTIKITSGSNKDGSNHDDFEFYQLELKGIRNTGWVLSGRVHMDGTPDRAGIQVYRHGTDELVSRSVTDSDGSYSLKLSNGEYDIKVESYLLKGSYNIQYDIKTIVINNSNVTLDFKASGSTAMISTGFFMIFLPVILPSIAAGFIMAEFIYKFTKRRKTAVYGFVLGTIGTCIVYLLMIMGGSLNDVTLSLLLSAGITFILVAVPIILLNRRKVS
jgi:hypothetical protein